MRFRLKFYFSIFSIFLCSISMVAASEFSVEIHASFGAPGLAPTTIFKIRDEVELHWFEPDHTLQTGDNPCLVYFHGGGWKGGSAQEAYRWCRYLAEHGVSAFSVGYQLANEEKGIKPTECLKDAKTAMRWVRSNARELKINPDRIAVGGNSAGGHLAAALATIEGFNHSEDDLTVSCRPDLLTLTSPVLDNGPGGYGNGQIIRGQKPTDFRVADFWQDFSPLHNLNGNLPDTLVLMGDMDPLIRMKSMNTFMQAVHSSGSDFEWWIFPGKGHGLNAQNKSYLTPELMHIYYAYHAFLSKHSYMDEPLPAGDEVRTLIKRWDLPPVGSSEEDHE